MTKEITHTALIEKTIQRVVDEFPGIEIDEKFMETLIEIADICVTLQSLAEDDEMKKEILRLADQYAQKSKASKSN
jgi:GTP1/Obg family GTP-binding protein